MISDNEHLISINPLAQAATCAVYSMAAHARGVSLQISKDSGVNIWKIYTTKQIICMDMESPLHETLKLFGCW